MNSVRTAVRELRKRRKLTQKELAERMGVAQGHVCDLERGRRSFSEETIRAAARALGVTAGALIDMSDTLQDRGAAA